MSTIDRLLEALSNPPFDYLLLVAGQPPVVHRDGEDQPAARSPVSAETIQRLVQEVGPSELDLGTESWSFEHRLGGRLYVFEGRTVAGDRQVRVRMLADDPSVEPASSEREQAPPPRPGDALDGVTPEATPRATRRPVPQALEPLLVELLDRGGSDLHLTTGEPPRVRIDGELRILEGHPAPTAEELRAMLEPVTPEKNRDEFAERHDTDFGFALAGRARFRANLFRDHGGIGAVFRQIPATIPSSEDLRLPPSVAELSDLARGLVLVTGPTGSGKSTTLAAIIDRANRTRTDHIITIEDPVEFVHPSKSCLVHQREVGTHTRSFAAALRAALREDPDVVLVGEMRDLETTRVAIETAETGHLVFGTLHTTSAAATVERLINQYPEGEQAQIRLMLAGTLKAVVAQSLLKKIGGGRVAAYEVLLVTPAISNLIREGKVFQIPSMMQTGRGRGMVLLEESLLELVKEGLVTSEEAFRKASDKKEFATRLRSAGIACELVSDEVAEEDRPRLHKVG